MRASSIASLAGLSIFTGGVTSAPASLTDQPSYLNTDATSVTNFDTTSSIDQPPASTATLSAADIRSLPEYSQASTFDEARHHLDQRDPKGGGGRGGGSSSVTVARSATQFGNRVNTFIPKAKEIISRRREDPRSDVEDIVDIVRTLNDLLKEAESMAGQEGDDGNQYKTFRDTIEDLKRKTKDQPPISDTKALDDAESAVINLETWVSKGITLVAVPRWILGSAAAAAAGWTLLCTVPNTQLYLPILLARISVHSPRI
jgi:hypothetical protein